jgi:ligand-binding sensor domain-containing protein/signal transduction histidine kinase
MLGIAFLPPNLRIMSKTSRYSLSPLSVLVFACCSLTASAQPQFDVWDTEKGLPQNSIQDILQTRDGYLWLTTADGLVRFDGAQFTVFNAGNSPGLKSNRFTTLFEDQDGVLWIGTEDGGLARYKDGAFITYTSADGLPANWVWQIRADPDPRGHLLVVTSAGIVGWPSKELLPRGTHGNLPAIRPSYVDRDGGVWSADGFNLYRVKAGVETTYTRKGGLLSARVTAMYQDREGSLWVATVDGGVLRFKDGGFRNYAIGYGQTKSCVVAFYEDRAGQLWLGTNAAGLVRLSHGNDDGRYDAAPQSERMRIYTTVEGLSSNGVKTIYEDAEGSLWLGTFANGLNRLRRQLITTYSQHDGLSADNVYPIYQDRADNIWMGTWSRGLTVYKDGAFTRYTKRGGLPAGDLITALAEDREGRVWIGGFGGVCWFKDGTFNSFPGKLALDGGGLSAIYQDHAGGFWFGTEMAGLYRYHDGTLSRLTTKDGLPSDGVRAIVEDGRGNVWLGTYGGLVRYKDDGFTVYTTRDGLASNRVRALYLDGEGTLWIGTYDGGLSRYKDGRFTSYTTRDGLFNSGVFQILEDDRANLWMSCNLGIYRVSKQELNDFAEGKIRTVTSIAYGKSDGMLNVECNGGAQPAGIRTRDGKLWFPTQQGVAIVDLKAVMTNSQPPPVVIESVSVDREARDLRQPLRIEPGQTNLEIHYTGLSFIKPEQIRFKYKLEGVDKDWVAVGNRRNAYYAHVPPGTYTFTVIAANSDGVWNTSGRQMRISVVPPFWRRWWFVALLAAALLGITYFFYRRRAGQWRRAQSVREAFAKQLIASQESERKRIAAELHDSLGQNLLVIKNRALLGANAATGSAAAEQFAEITASASQAIEEVREIAYNLRPFHLDRLGLTSTIEAMIEKVAAASAIHFTADIASLDKLFPTEAEINLYRIVQESVNNIVKHSGATAARVEITRAARFVYLNISDNGRGFLPEAATATAARGRGFGLIGISERVRMLGGTHTIQSAAGHGTTWKIKLSLPESSAAKDADRGPRNGN